VVATCTVYLSRDEQLRIPCADLETARLVAVGTVPTAMLELAIVRGCNKFGQHEYVYINGELKHGETQEIVRGHFGTNGKPTSTNYQPDL